MRVGTAEARGTVVAVENAVDPGEVVQTGAAAIGQNHVGDIEIALAALFAIDLHEDNPRTGRIVLEHGGRIAGGGLVLERAAGRGSPAPPRWRRSCARRSIGRRARRARRRCPPRHLPPRGRGPIAFTTSFGLEDQVILHMICEAGLDIEVVTLDTGRLFPETHAIWEATEQRYGRRIRAIASAAWRARSAGHGAGHQWVLSLARGPGRVLRRAQGRAAQPGACRRRRLDHRAARRPVGPSRAGRPRRRRNRAWIDQARPAA